MPIVFGCYRRDFGDRSAGQPRYQVEAEIGAGRDPGGGDVFVGIDPSRKKYVAIKSRVHWRADLGKIAREIVECAGVGVCTSDYGQLTFRKVRRPVFPLDRDLQWNRPA